jgi:uncharacterized protein involved in response to NO
MTHFFFNMAFRPLFLLAALYAPLIVGLWIGFLYGGPDFFLEIANPIMWHSHEMLYGFVAAGIGGFMFTAVANWTGRAPVQGLTLLTMCLLWIAGRVVMIVGGQLPLPIVTLIDISYLLMVAVVLGRELYLAGNKRNYILLGCVLLLLLSNIIYHLEIMGIVPPGQWGNRAGIGTVLLLLSIVGGRITPAFSRNWLNRVKPGALLPAESNRFDVMVLVMMLSIIPLWTLFPWSHITGYAFIGVGVLQAVRVLRWRGWAVIGEPLLLILHIGYSWISVGMVLSGAGILFGFPASAGLHALTTGAITTMILAVAARAGMGHSGREVESNQLLNLIFISITMTSVLRIMAAFSMSQFTIQLSGYLWILTFILFLVAMAPILLAPPRENLL